MVAKKDRVGCKERLGGKRKQGTYERKTESRNMFHPFILPPIYWVSSGLSPEHIFLGLSKFISARGVGKRVINIL